MTPDAPGDVTRLLQAIRAGHADAEGRLVELIYQELRRMASGLLHENGTPPSWQPTALVHEAYLRLNARAVLHHAPDRRYLYAAAAQAMRQILVDHARFRNADKRGGGRQRQPLDSVLDHFERQNLDVVALHDALNDLQAFDERQSRIVTLRFFGGLTTAEIAEQLDISTATVEREFREARAWLRQQLTEGEP